MSGPDETPVRVHKALSHLVIFWGNLMYCVTCHIYILVWLLRSTNFLSRLTHGEMESLNVFMHFERLLRLVTAS